jgi:anionic cell wall polymer biosynthesis LytR-Cps2A-Psr (LCP) family protein
MDDEKNNDPIGKALGLPSQNTTSIVSNIISEAHNDSASNDFESARANIHTMIDTAQDAIEALYQIAKSSQHPRAFEVLAKLVESNIKANESLLNIQSKIREIKEADEPLNKSAKITTNNNLFVGSTAELQKMLKQLKEESDKNE